ncbi:MAG: LptF/LptG family permease [Treponema sp.]|nr:LptF/LptG family permease [Treponema sp.]
MKLVIYMYKKFFTVFLGSLFFFVLVLILTDLFMNLWSYISKNAQLTQVCSILLHYVPKSVWYSVPMAVLFSTAYMLSDLYAKNELLAVFASGISLIRFSAPLLVVALVMSFGLFFFEDNIVVPTYAKKVKMQEFVLHKEKSLNNDNIVVMSDGGRIVWKASNYNEEGMTLSDIYILFRNQDKSFDCLIYAPFALWGESVWLLPDATLYKRDEKSGFLVFSPDEKHLSLLTEPPETFRNNTVNVETVNTREAREYIAHLEKAGLPSGEARSLYYKKYSFPFVVFIVVFLAVGLSGKTRKNVLIISLALCVSAAVLFYVIQMITMLMARFGTIPPLTGAWFPVFLFIAISCLLLKYAKT